MDLTGKHVLLLSPEPWDNLPLSKHDLAHTLVQRGNSVCFWGPPEHRLMRVNVEGQWPLQHVNYGHWLRGVNRLPKWLHMRYYERMVRKLEALTGRGFDVIWCFDISRMQWFPEHPALKVLHLADHDILDDHPGIGLARTADVIFTVTGALRDAMLQMMPSAQVHNVGHAVAEEWLAGRWNAPDPDARIQVAYAGHLETDYIDWEVLHKVILDHPTVLFHFYGPFDRNFPAFKLREVLDRPNVRLYGRVDRARLIPALRGAHLLLLCYRPDKYGPFVANSHKLLEYLATGNPVVCSRTEEYLGHDELMLMADRRWEFPALFDRALERMRELHDPGRRAARIAHATARTAHRMIDQLAPLLPDARRRSP